MWQLLLTAAVAGSTGFIAKHIFSDHHQSHTGKCDDGEGKQQDCVSTPALESPSVVCGYESNCDQDGIFRFSSSGSCGSSGKKKKKEIRNSKKKLGILCRRLKFREKIEKSSSGSEVSGKRVCVCFKKRRNGKGVAAKCGSCSSEGSALFSWGLGVGIMYMMSAGKAEMNKLSAAMDETSKVVQELRTEYKRKSGQIAASSKNMSIEHAQLVINRSSMGDKGPCDMKLCGLPMTDDVECPSSVLTEEPEPVVLEMDQLEAELESELQKLPGSSSETSGRETRPNLGKAMVLSEGFSELEEQNVVSYQCHGVLPTELDNKLCHLLIEQQENQISGLESELHSARSKLHEKEDELQALKDCVRRLTSFSLSDDEVEVQPELTCNGEWDNNSKMGCESRKSVVGMKRPIDSAWLG